MSIFTLCVQCLGFGGFLLLFPVRGLPVNSFNKNNISKKATIYIISLIPVFGNSESESFLAVYHKHTILRKQ